MVWNSSIFRNGIKFNLDFIDIINNELGPSDYMRGIASLCNVTNEGTQDVTKLFKILFIFNKFSNQIFVLLNSVSNNFMPQNFVLRMPTNLMFENLLVEDIF